MKEEKRWCYGCGETKILNPENWTWANKEHTRFKTKCRKCTNYESMISHRIQRSKKRDLPFFLAITINISRNIRIPLESTIPNIALTAAFCHNSSSS